MDRVSALSLLRQLYRELRRTRSMGQKYVYGSKHWQFIVSTVRSTRQLEPSHADAKRLGIQGQNYLQYLQSSRIYAELLDRYQGRGERNPEDLAKILGFRMPNEPKEPRKPRSSESVNTPSDVSPGGEKSSSGSAP